MQHLRLVSLCAAIATATAIAQTPAERFHDRLEVQVVNLEVVVTDEEGNAVAGLPRDAFQVNVDGEPVPIHYFSELRTPSQTTTSEAEAHGEKTVTALAQLERPPANYLVFVDNLLTLARNRDFVLGFVRQQLEEMRPQDRMAVVTYDGDRMRVLAEWTSSKPQLREALNTASRDSSWGIRYIALRRMEDYVANWEGRATRRSVQAVTAGLHALPVPEGRKVLLLVAGSWDPAEVNTAGNFSDWCLQAGGCSGTRIFTALTDTANRLGYSIYAVDVEGRDPNQNWSREKRIQGLLGRLADETGGRTLLNNQRRKMLATAVADASSFYSLGLQIEVAEDAQRHGIEVTVQRPGLQVRTKKSFLPLPAGREHELEIFHKLLLGTGGPPPFDVTFGPTTRHALTQLEIPTEIQVPISRVEWIPNGDELRARFEIELLVLDPNGASSQVATQEVNLVRQQRPSATAIHTVELTILTRRSSRNLGVTVRDLQGEESWFGVVRFPHHRSDGDAESQGQDFETPPPAAANSAK